MGLFAEDANNLLDCQYLFLLRREDVPGLGSGGRVLGGGSLGGGSEGLAAPRGIQRAVVLDGFVWAWERPSFPSGMQPWLD